MLPLRQAPFNRLPLEIRPAIYEELDFQDLTNLRTSSNEMMEDPVLEAVQLDVRKDKALQSYLKLKGHTWKIPQGLLFVMKEKLDAYMSELNDAFLNKTKEQIVEEGHAKRWGLLAEQMYKVDYDHRHQKAWHCVIWIKRDILLQEQFLAIARVDQADAADTLLHSAVGNEGATSQVAALFSSNPIEMLRSINNYRLA